MIMGEKRFDIIEHCDSGCALLIDHENELPAVPLGFSLDMLDDEDKMQLGKWLDHLNGDEVQTTLKV